DLEIIPRRVRERAPAIAISHRPDARDVGAQLIVDLDIAALVGGDASLIEAEIIRIRSSADRDQHVCSDDARNLSRGLDFDGDGVPRLRNIDYSAIGLHMNPFLLEESSDSLRDVLVLARDQARRELNHRHLASKTAIHLREFKADVAASQDDEMRREEINV